MSPKTYTLSLRTGLPGDERCTSHGLNYNSPRTATMEYIGPIDALVFCDTKDHDEPGFFLNVVMVSEETGEPSQWCSRDPVMKFDEAIAEVGQLATSTLGQFMSRMARMEQIL